MITSAPFDDWWHNAYGLDVKILSPPHVVLAIGMVAVEIGTLVLIAAGMNRSSGRVRRGLEWLFLYVSQHDPRGVADVRFWNSRTGFFSIPPFATGLSAS